MAAHLFSRREVLLAGPAAALLMAQSGCARKHPVGPILRRKSLTRDFSREEQRELSDLLYAYLTPELIDAHMHQVDHLDNLFTDHRTYLYEIEKLLIRDGHTKYVPLPIWDPLDDLPDGWDRVHPPYDHMRLTPFNRIPRAIRPEIDPELRPDRLAEDSFPTALELAKKIGRSARSAPDSYHFFSHAVLGGPFIMMSTAASALIFWAYHGLLVDLYDRWLSHRLPGQSARTVAGRTGDGRLEVFTVTSHHQLWHAWQRRTTTHYDDLDRPHGAVEVTFPHWSHWFRLDAPPITDLRVATDGGGGLALLAKAGSGDPASVELLLMRRAEGASGSWISLCAEVAEIPDFGLVLDADGALAVVAIRQTPGGRVVSARTETTPGSGAFGLWVDVLPVGEHRALALDTYRDANGRAFPQILVTEAPTDAAGSGSASRLVHAWQEPSGWRYRTLAEERYDQARMATTPDGLVRVVAVRAEDGLLYQRRTLSPGESLGAEANWSAWERVGGGATPFRELALGQHEDGRLEAFAIDAAGAVHHSGEAASGTWSEWSAIPTMAFMGAVREPVAARDYTDRLRVFVQGEDGFTHLAEQLAPNGAAWVGWTSI